MSKTVVSSWNDFDPLEHVIVGRADFTCIPPTEPATEAKIPEDSAMRGRCWGPRPLETVERANEQLDHFAQVLEGRGDPGRPSRLPSSGTRRWSPRTSRRAACSAACRRATCC